MDLKDKLTNIDLDKQGIAELLFDLKISLDIILGVMIDSKLIDKIEFETKYNKLADSIIKVLDKKREIMNQKNNEMKELIYEAILKGTDPKGNA